MVKEQCEHAVFSAMRELANQEVDNLEGRLHKVYMQGGEELFEEPTGDGPGESSGGKEGDKACPGNGDGPDKDYPGLQIDRSKRPSSVSRASSWELLW